MKKSQTLKDMFEIETVFKFQSDSKAALFPTQLPTDNTTTSSTSLVTSFQTTSFGKASAAGFRI